MELIFCTWCMNAAELKGMTPLVGEKVSWRNLSYQRILVVLFLDENELYI